MLPGSSCCLALIVSSSYVAVLALPTQIYVPGSKVRFGPVAMLNKRTRRLLCTCEVPVHDWKMESQQSLEWFKSSLQSLSKYSLRWRWGRTRVKPGSIRRTVENLLYVAIRLIISSVAVKTMWCLWKRIKYRNRKRVCGHEPVCVLSPCFAVRMSWVHNG